MCCKCWVYCSVENSCGNCIVVDSKYSYVLKCYQNTWHSAICIVHLRLACSRDCGMEKCQNIEPMFYVNWIPVRYSPTYLTIWRHVVNICTRVMNAVYVSCCCSCSWNCHSPLSTSSLQSKFIITIYLFLIN